MCIDYNNGLIPDRCFVEDFEILLNKMKSNMQNDSILIVDMLVTKNDN